MKFDRLALCFVLLFAASTCFAQMYTVTEIAAMSNDWFLRYGINNSGQVAGTSHIPTYAFRTAPNSTMNPMTDYLGTLGGLFSHGTAINDSGQVVGFGPLERNPEYHAFRTAPNRPINPETDDLGTLGGGETEANAINDSGQVVGVSATNELLIHAFRTGPNSPINPETDDLGTLGSGLQSYGYGINSSGQAVGTSFTNDLFCCRHAFRTAPNRPINSETDDLGTLGGATSVANAINNSGQVVGWAAVDDANDHAFRTAPNRPINPATDDLGALGGCCSAADGVDSYGQVVGYAYTSNGPYEAFLYSGGVMHNLNSFIPSGYPLLMRAFSINDAGQIVVGASTKFGWYSGPDIAYLLTPVYTGIVQQPINADGSSVFSAKRGVVPVKFAMTQYGKQPSCTLPATIAITRTSGGAFAAVDESTFSMQADDGSNFRIDSIACQYMYNLSASSLGVGTYRIDISINGIMVGHAVFALK